MFEFFNPLKKTPKKTKNKMIIKNGIILMINVMFKEGISLWKS